MAVSKSASTWEYAPATTVGWYNFDISFTEKSTSVANNTSTIEITGKISSKNISFADNAGSTLVIWWQDDNAHTSWYKVKSLTVGSIDINGSRSITGTITVTHKSDGSLKGRANVDWNKAGSNTWNPPSIDLSTDYANLTKIARASTPTLSSSSLVLNGSNKVTINTNRASSSFTHTISYSCGGSTGTIASNVGGSTTWTPPISLLTKFNNSDSISCTITCVTYNGNTNVGSKTVTLTLKNPGASSVKVNTDSNFTIGDTITINITRASSSFLHEVIFKYGTNEISLGTSVGTSVTYDTNAIKDELLALIPNNKSYTHNTGIYCRTYFTSGGTQYTVKSAVNGKYIANVPSSLAPILSNYTNTETSDIEEPLGTNDVIRYISKKRVTIDAIAQGGATLNSAVLTVGSQTFTMSKNEDTFSANATNLTSSKFEIEVFDSRGLSSKYTATGVFYEYEYPTIINSSFQRVSAISDQGSFSASGTYWNDLNNELTATYIRNDQSQPTQIQVNYGTGNAYSVEALQSGLNYDESFTVTLTIKDKFGSTAKKELVLSVAQWSMWLGKNTMRTRDLVVSKDSKYAMYNSNDVLKVMDGDKFEDILAWDSSDYSSLKTTVNNHTTSLNNIGVPLVLSNTTKNLANRTYVNFGSITLTPGIWLLIGSIYFPKAAANNSTGWIYVGENTYGGNNPQTNGSTAINTYEAHVATKSVVYSPASNMTVNLIGWQNSGSALNNCIGYMRAVRIK